MLSFIARSLAYYRRTHLAVVAGVATAVAVLTGALLVGGSVRESLRDLVIGRLGRVEYVATGVHYFRDQLAAETGGTPLIVTEGAVTNAATKRRAGGVAVYGIDERFWKFHGLEASAGSVLISPGLAAETGPGELLLRVDQPSAIPKESLHGRKDEGRTIRLNAPGVLAPDHLGEFSLRPQQGAVKAVFLPLRRLQRELAESGHVNTLLFPPGARPQLKGKVTLDDLGVKIREIDGGVSVESDQTIVSNALEEAVGPDGQAVFAHLANSIQVKDRVIPYSLVAGVDARLMKIADGEVYLNEWAAKELGAKAGDTATFDFYVWSDGGNLLTKSAQFRVEGVLPIRGLAADRDLTPEYPGITAAKTLRDWDPSFPMDLGRIGPRDEAYWEKYRTTPKAFVSIATAQKLWQTRFGRMTSLRVAGVSAAEERTRLTAKVDPENFGLAIYAPRSMGVEGARGSTDFGEYFTYFSFFLVVSALLLTALFFRLSVEQRLRQIGTLAAVGWRAGQIQHALLGEGLMLAIAGSAIGVAGGIGYCAFVLYGLRTWWRDAVGTSALRLHVDAGSLATGAVSGLLVAAVVIWLALRGLRRLTPRALLAGDTGGVAIRGGSAWVRWTGIALIIIALGMTSAGAAKALPAAEVFFGAGSTLLTGALMLLSGWLRSTRKSMWSPGRPASIWSLGYRNASHRPGRSLLCIALIASAVFLLVALDAFRQTGTDAAGTGGFAVMAESQLPVLWDPNTPAGRENLNLTPVADQLREVHFYPFRLRPGEDASCLNLYEPRNPRMLGARSDFIAKGRFRFAESLAKSDEQKRNPWLLLQEQAGDGVIPGIADANSILYVLHKKVGDEMTVDGQRVRLVAALDGSALQSEIIVSEQNFVRMFPAEQGFRFFLIDAPSVKVGDVLEEALSDYGFDATPVAERVASYHRVENTYLSTFQALGALGLLLGTVGLAAVLLRNVLERRRELALLGALGFRPGDLGRMVIAENAFLVLCGLLTGGICAVVAVAPTVLARGSGSLASLGGLLLAVPATALLASLFAVRAAWHAPMLETLRSE